MKIIKQLWWFFSLEKKAYLIGILSLCLVSLLNLLPASIMGQLIDQIASGQLTEHRLLLGVAGLILSALAMYGLRYLWRMNILATSYRLGKIMRARLFDHFMHLSPSFFQQHRTGDLMAHATNDINALTRLAGGGVMSFVDATVTALVTLITMSMSISWQMTLIAILPLPFMTLTTNFLGRRTHENFKASQAAFSELNNKVQEAVSGIKATKSFGYQEQETAAFQEVNQAAFLQNIKTMRYDALFNPAVLFFIGLSYLLTLLVGSHFISQGQVSLGQLVTFMTYLDLLVWPLMAIGFLVNISQRGDVSYNRIQTLLSISSEVIETDQPLPAPSNGEIVYEISEFAYDNIPVLQDIQFHIKKGQTIGLVGPTGSGKTSLLKLLMREYDVTQGQILLNQENIKNYKLADLRRLIGYVPQDQFLFATSITENIRFGNPDLSLNQVEEAARAVYVYEDIQDMPDRFETMVGEKGISLSGGQKQRLAMARAMILNPDILLLDDSLSAVDAKTEHAILETIKQERLGKTTIITAHRLSAIVHADLILVLEDGKIVERGRHQELLDKKGWYYNTYMMQQLEKEESDAL
ncbi:ATP-binding cassette domain-containing protein [Streptococcus suis]|uniref:ATP-binding cassette domain-containing protein n=2 Tax=Streptococcus suis TaxID=1307 RepID=A0A9Q5BRS2_STRSU|nr:ABC transporter transmembrane domain-containing protein [Streptococcus suis]MCK3905959.1 ATP-binding cassette domain-containing protein [Streptococcus suis]MCK3959596.1 ATP-binding cassette domain-containing protein [Streptococcus suis]MCK4022855.1 ATP-binding cassette domain-containing protein [Streptococcus suis]MCK4065059.1 ATP-binding cassette domain-containing protein [Streptococcus suis]MCQ9275960.1 ABC transporter transmembrane domain-containing protein [Streptococcus suis]